MQCYMYEQSEYHVNRERECSMLHTCVKREHECSVLHVH